MKKKKPILKLEIKVSKDIFMLFLALNLTGYNDENNKKGIHPVRREARNLLKEQNWDKKYPYFKKILKKTNPWHLIRELLKNNKSIKKNKTAAYYFNLNIKKFAQEPSTRRMWRFLKKYYLKEIKKLFPILKKETTRMMVFIDKPSKNFKKVILIPNLLDAFWRGYGLKIKNTGYIVVGPGAEKNQGELMRHEFLHLFSPQYRISKRFLLEKDHRRAAKIGYIGRNIIRKEYIILALNLLYESKILKKNITQDVIRQKRHFPYLEEVIELIKKQIKK